MFKSNDVVLSTTKNISSISNNFHGSIIDIIPTRHGMEITVDIGIKVSAIITQESLDKFNLSKNSSVWIGIKATAINFIQKE